MDRPCNCTPTTLANGKCLYNGQCRTSCIVYEVRCKTTGDIYKGNTHEKLKYRMAGHYSDVQRLIQKGKRSDSFATHFAALFEPGSKPSPSQMREKMTFSVLWKGNPISVQKTFGTKNCLLCMKERTQIIKNS